MMKKLVLILGACVIMGILSGCIIKNDAPVIESTAEIAEETTSSTEEIHTEEVSEEDTQEWTEEYTHESRLANVVTEDEEFVYFCGFEHILKWSKTDGSAEKIWVSDKEHSEDASYMYSYERGILLGDKLYFIERWDETPWNKLEPGTVQALSVVNTDGSDYRMIAKIAEEEEAQLVLLDGILYYAQETSTKALKGFVADNNGELLTDVGEVYTEPANLPKDCTEVSYYNNGTRYFTAVESAYHLGYYLLRDEDYALCAVDQDTGEKTLLFDKVGNATPVAYNSTHFLFRDYAYEFFYLINNRTWEKEVSIFNDADISVIGMDEEYIYWQRYDKNMEQYIYERVTVDGTSTEQLFEEESFIGMGDTSPWYLMDVTVLDDYMYYVGSQDYKYILMRRNLNEPWEREILGEAFYDSGILRVGTITAYRENIFSDTKPDMILGSTDLEWLIVHEHFPGAAKINAILDAEQEANMEYERNIAKDMEEWAEDGLNSSISSRVSPIFFFNERFISYTQQEYEYSGGAHGMPYWVPHTFDLHTGEELGLDFFVANDETEFKDIVTEQFIKMYEVDPALYWDDAVEMVRESVGYESPYYLKEDGLVIYYGPYDLAPYAAGFVEIVVPYENLELFVPIDR